MGKKVSTLAEPTVVLTRPLTTGLKVVHDRLTSLITRRLPAGTVYTGVAVASCVTLICTRTGALPGSSILPVGIHSSRLFTTSTKVGLTALMRGTKANRAASDKLAAIV